MQRLPIDTELGVRPKPAIAAGSPKRTSPPPIMLPRRVTDGIRCWLL